MSTVENLSSYRSKEYSVLRLIFPLIALTYAPIQAVFFVLTQDSNIRLNSLYGDIQNALTGLPIAIWQIVTSYQLHKHISNPNYPTVNSESYRRLVRKNRLVMAGGCVFVLLIITVGIFSAVTARSDPYKYVSVHAAMRIEEFTICVLFFFVLEKYFVDYGMAGYWAILRGKDLVGDTSSRATISQSQP